jgi:putative ABC transport system permease protein
MLGNYLKVTLRNLRRNKVYSMINITGLALGIAGFLFILLVVQHEFTYDRHHKHADRIHLVVTRSTINGRTGNSPISSAPIGPGLYNDYPEVENAVRFRQLGATLRYADREFNENALFFADPSVFDIFTYPLLAGNPATALRDPYSIVLTEKLARKYFGDKNPLNQTLRLDNKHDFVVTGLMRDVPPNSSFSFDALISFATAEEWGVNQHIGHSAYLTYLLLADGATAADIEEGISVSPAAVTSPMSIRCC